MFPLPPTQLFETLALPDVEAGLAIMREQGMTRLRPFLLRLYDTAEARHTMQNPEQNQPVMFLGTQRIDAIAQTEIAAFLTIAQRHGGKTLGPDGALRWMDRHFDFSTVENLLDSDSGFAETIEIAHTRGRASTASITPSTPP